MKIITISREFGSGGRSIAKAVADKLGIAYYDKELVRQVATETGYAEEFVEQKGEYASTSNWLAYALSQRGGPGMPNMISADDFLWAIQRKVILELAEKGPCLPLRRFYPDGSHRLPERFYPREYANARPACAQAIWQFGNAHRKASGR